MVNASSKHCLLSCLQDYLEAAGETGTEPKASCLLLNCLSSPAHLKACDLLVFPVFDYTAWTLFSYDPTHTVLYKLNAFLISLQGVS